LLDGDLPLALLPLHGDLLFAFLPSLGLPFCSALALCRPLAGLALLALGLLRLLRGLAFGGAPLLGLALLLFLLLVLLLLLVLVAAVLRCVCRARQGEAEEPGAQREREGGA